MLAPIQMEQIPGTKQHRIRELKDGAPLTAQGMAYRRYLNARDWPSVAEIPNFDGWVQLGEACLRAAVRSLDERRIRAAADDFGYALPPRRVEFWAAAHAHRLRHCELTPGERSLSEACLRTHRETLRKESERKAPKV